MKLKRNAKLAAQWQGWSARFAALQQREKTMVIGATLFAILYGGYSFWIEPAQLQKARLTKNIQQQRTEQAQLSAKLVELAARNTDPDAANRAAIEKAQRDMAALDEEVRDYDRILVPPREAPALLQTLLARHRGLSLVKLATLPPEPLVAPPIAAGAAGAAADALPATMTGNLYKHGIEIRISGRYHDLLAYIADLEGGKQKLLWGGMSLTSQYPESELTLTVYTLSLESAWLVV